MAILALTTDMVDMKNKLSKIVVANDLMQNPVTVEDLVNHIHKYFLVMFL